MNIKNFKFLLVSKPKLFNYRRRPILLSNVKNGVETNRKLDFKTFKVNTIIYSGKIFDFLNYFIIFNGIVIFYIFTFTSLASIYFCIYDSISKQIKPYRENRYL